MEQMADRGRSLELNHLSWPEVRVHLERDPRLIMPVGALDHHGPHLPLGANTLIAERVAQALSGHLNVIVAPTFHYGLTKPDWTPYPGTSTLRRKTFHRAINELLASWDDHGIAEVIVITAQRHEPHLESLLTALTSTSTTEVVDLMTIDVGDLVEGRPEHERGGELETSLLLHLAPELVRMDQAADYVDHAGPPGKYVQGRVTSPHPDFQGVVGRPTLATAEKGKAVFERYVSLLQAALSHTPGASL